MPKFEEITPKVLSELSDQELISTHRRIHQWWAEGLFNDEAIYNAHEFVVEEIKKRDMKHDSPLLPEDRGKKKENWSFPDPESFYHSLPDTLVLIPEYASVSGSYADDHTTAEDIDLIIKSTEDETGFSQTMMKIPRAVPPEMRDLIHFVPNPQGAFFNFIPFYDLTLTKRKGFEKRNVDGDLNLTGFESKRTKQDEVEAGRISLGKPYLTNKTATGFFDFKELWEKWAKKRIADGAEIAVEKKFDGIKGSINRDGDQIKIFTEDAKQDIAWKLPELIPAIKAQTPDKFIAEVELVQYDESDNPKRRQEMAALFAGKEQVRDFRAHVYDLLWLGGDNLTDKPFSERRKLLEQNFKSSKILEVIPSKTAKTKSELKKLVDIVSREVGSEGAMLKDVGGPYELDRITDWQSKIKNVIEVDVRIIGYRKQPLPKPEKRKMTAAEMEKLLPDLLKGSNTFTYRVAVVGPDGDEIPIEADKTLTDGDLNLVWDEERQKWKGTDDPKLWTMARGWRERKHGELAYGNTYAAQLTPHPSLGDIITVAPVEVTEFKPGHFSWTFPNVRSAKPQAVLPGEIRALKPIIKKAESDDVTEKAKREFEEELPLTSEEQQFLTEQAIGDYYLVLEDGKKHRGVIQHHLRGAWTDKEREQIKKSWRAAANQEDVDKLAKDWDISFLKITPDQLIRRVSIADDSTKAIDNALRKPKIGDPIGDLVNRASVHSDIRLEAPGENYLIGWTLNTPPSAIMFLENGNIIYPIRDKFLDNKEKDNIVAEKKLPQPKKWLTIAEKDKPFVTTRTELGATAKTSGIFFAEDFFDLVYGAQKSDFHEYFLFFDDQKNKEISGRWIVRIIPGSKEFEKVEGPFWQFSRPMEQVPYIQTHDKSAEEEKARKEKIKMIWNEKAIDILERINYPDLKTEEKSKSISERSKFNVSIAKMDHFYRYILGVVMIPDREDSEGDSITGEEIRKAEKAFRRNGAKIGINHEGVIDSLFVKKSIVLDEQKTFIDVEGKQETFPKDTWMIRIGLNNDETGNEIWQRALKKEITGFSWEAPVNKLRVLE